MAVQRSAVVLLVESCSHMQAVVVSHQPAGLAADVYGLG